MVLQKGLDSCRFLHANSSTGNRTCYHFLICRESKKLREFDPLLMTEQSIWWLNSTYDKNDIIYLVRLCQFCTGSVEKQKFTSFVTIVKHH